MSKLVVTAPEIEAQRIEAEDDGPTIGSWWWVKGSEEESEHEYDEDEAPRYDRGTQWLGCVIEIGSNYVKLKGVKLEIRLSLDEMPSRCIAEHEPHTFIDAKVNEHRTKVRQLMGKIQAECARLGVPMNQALAEAASPMTALAVAHGVEDVNRYQKALVKAKDKTLPELFERVKKQHKHMATWMSAELIPAHAELERAKGVTSVIKSKIHTVELYAGLNEKLVCVREGEPAAVDTKVHLMQRRHYMDEECLIRYEAGGMDFENIKAFDKWIARDEHMTRILPHERCIIAFRIRRYDKDYEIGDSLSRFLRFGFYNEYNKATFLYIRNGRQLWRMRTAIEFGPELFPRREDEDLIGDDELWVRVQGTHDAEFISGRHRAAMIEVWKRRRSELARDLWEWKRQGKPEKEWSNPHNELWSWVYPRNGDPYRIQGREHGRPDDYPDAGWRRYERVTPEHTYHDDAMEHVREVAAEHNRIAVVVQGLLDRSTCLHPHPPWRIWTPEGFAQGIELVYDTSLAITPGAAPDWEGYRRQLNKSLRPGAYCIGQEAVWRAEMEDKYEKLWEARRKHGDGPDFVDRITNVRAGKAQFKWERESRRGRWIPASRPGYRQLHYDKLDESWWCSLDQLTCIDAYTPGDFHMFFDDPRTRAQYIQWAPILLAAEDWHAERRKSKDEAPKAEEETDDVKAEEEDDNEHVPNIFDDEDDEDEDDDDEDEDDEEDDDEDEDDEDADDLEEIESNGQ